MAKYFIGDYPEIYEELSDTTKLTTSKEVISSTIDEVNSEMAGITGILDELEGNYNQELASTLKTISDEIETLYTVITNGLTDVLNNVNDLGGNLGDFKTNDEKLEEDELLLDSEKKNEPLKYNVNTETSKREITKAWENWKGKVDGIFLTIRELEKVVLSLKDTCDVKIDKIDEFNDNIVDIRLKLASIAYVQQGLTLDDIKNMTPEEKEAFIKEIIDAMTVKYNEYKQKYEAFITAALEDERLKTMINIYKYLVDDFAPYSWDGIVCDSLVGGGSQLYDFFKLLEDSKTEDGRNLIDCMTAYANGESWVDSGLFEFYRRNRSMDSDAQDPIYSENQFKENVEPYSDLSARELIAESAAYYTDHVSNVNNFMENYENALKVGVSINGLKELEGHVKYDAYTLNPDFEGHDFSHWNDDQFINKIWIVDDVDINKFAYMSSNEVEMYKYLYDTQGVDAANEYIGSIGKTLKRREGYVKGSVYYARLIDGDNSGVDAILDHLSIGATGYGDGVVHYLDGFVDLVAPSKEMSVDEYAAVTLLGRLTNGGTSYDNSLLTTYNITNTLGKKTIPIILDIVRPGLGSRTEMISDFGNSIEDYMRADDNATYVSALWDSAVDLIGDKGIEAAAKFYGLDVTPMEKLGVATIKTIYGSGVKAMRGNDVDWFGDLTGGLEKNMLGQISGSLSEKVSSDFEHYIDSSGWSPAAARVIKAGASPLIETGTSIVTDGGYAAVKTATNNAAYGKNDSIIGSFMSTVEDRLGSNVGKVVPKSVEKTAKEIFK